MMNGQAFIKGYEHVIQNAISCSSISGTFVTNKNLILKTPREVCTKYPDFSYSEVNSFLNGVDDALIGDSFRYRAVKACQEALPILKGVVDNLETKEYYYGGEACFDTLKKVIYGDK
jgi:hypothetical protein